MKQRLIGAAVLVALAVIFLPMLVDGPEPQTATSSVPLDIPTPPERNFETRELPVVATTPVPGGTPARPVDDPNRVVTVQADDTPRVDALPEDFAREPAVSTAPATRPASTATVPGATATPAQSAPSTAAAAPAPTPGGRFVVNLGSYANVANAQSLVQTLKAAGLSAYADEVQIAGKPGRRVRIGPFAQRGEAEAARLAATRVRKDIPAAVVAIDSSESPAAPAPVRPAAASGFAVQIGALKSEADANTLRDRARGAGFTAYVERVNAEAGALYRVRVGPELQRANAEGTKASLKQKLQIDGVVVTHP